MLKKCTVCGALLLMLALLQFSTVAFVDEKFLPTEAVEEYNTRLSAAYQKMPQPIKFSDLQAKQKEIATEVLKLTKTQIQDPQELIHLAQLYQLAQMSKEAIDVTAKLKDGSTEVAQEALLLYLLLQADDGNLNAVESGIEEYRRKFDPQPQFFQNLQRPLSVLARHYSNQGNHDRVVDLVLEEINSLNDEAPYTSWMMLNQFSSSFTEAGRRDELLEACHKAIEKLEASEEKVTANMPEDASQQEKARLQLYPRLIQSVQATLNRYELIGMPAPELTFTSFFNTAPITLEDLKGKVVMLDFWANWCEPCKVAFPELRELYEKYRDKGFVIVGVTSLQGRFADGDIQKNGLTPEEELELTRDFIDRHNMTWPVAFTEASVFNPDYGVTGIPTFAIIDRKGIIRDIQVGSGEQAKKSLEELIPALLDE